MIGPNHEATRELAKLRGKIVKHEIDEILFLIKKNYGFCCSLKAANAGVSIMGRQAILNKTAEYSSTILKVWNKLC